MSARIAVLVSGNGGNLQAIVDACATGRLAGRVVLVVSNRSGARALERASIAGIPATVVEAQSGESRRQYDARLRAVVLGSSPDVVVLAGFLRLLGAEFLDGLGVPVVNVHPALPGDLPGLEAIERAHAEAREAGRTRTGVMVHLVADEGVDDGPVLASEEVTLDPTETLQALAERIHGVEHRLIVAVLAELVAATRDTTTHHQTPTLTGDHRQ